VSFEYFSGAVKLDANLFWSRLCKRCDPGIGQLLIVAKVKDISVLMAELFECCRDLLECLLANLRVQEVVTTCFCFASMIPIPRE